MKNGVQEAGDKGRRLLGSHRQWLAFGTLALVIVMALLASYGIMEFMERRAHSAAEKLVRQVVEHIDDKMNDVRNVTRETAMKAYAMIDDPEALEGLVYDFVGQNAFVYGSTVAFEPDAFPDRGRCFAPYSWKGTDEKVHSRQLGTETDYYEEEWYAETKRTGQEYWCEPYYDEGGAKTMMCTFSVPLIGTDGGLIAVMTADVGLEDLETYIASINPYNDSDIMLFSGRGTRLVNTDADAAAGNGSVIIKGLTDIGWSVELTLPFTHLMRGDTGVYFIIGIVLLMTILVVVFVNRMLLRLQKRASEEYINVIDAISSRFGSIYLVDLPKDEMIVFRDPGHYEQIIDSHSREKVGFTATMRKLIACDCYSQDCERMRGEITCETIHNRLCTQERYVVRFRKDQDGGAYWYEMQVFVMERDKAREPVRAVVAFTDVNENVRKEKQAQDTLEQALKMAESANRAKTVFLNNMSHDIRTPMNAIIGYTSLAMGHIENREQVQDYLDKIGKSSTHLLSLINDVLDMSRIESGKMSLNEQAENLNEILRSLYDIVQADINAKQLTFTVDASEVKNEGVICDKLRLNQVLLNIVSNAIKYTAPGGSISMCVSEGKGHEDGYASYEFVVRDNGMGMDQKFLKTIFDPFTRVNNSTVSGIQGTGLGMAITKNIVDMMGGNIAVVSEPQKGTQVTIRFDFRLQSMTKAEDEQKASYNFAGKKVLLVEDNELNREIASEILSEEGFVIDTAEDGCVAVEKMKNARVGAYDLVLMDIQMPRMDGYEATRQIRAMGTEISKIPIIAMTANAFEEDRRAAFDAGMNEHIAKPIDIAGLKEMLTRFL